jgi:hypothetical protein
VTNMLVILLLGACKLHLMFFSMYVIISFLLLIFNM